MVWYGIYDNARAEGALLYTAYFIARVCADSSSEGTTHSDGGPKAPFGSIPGSRASLILKLPCGTHISTEELLMFSGDFQWLPVLTRIAPVTVFPCAGKDS